MGIRSLLFYTVNSNIQVYRFLKICLIFLLTGYLLPSAWGQQHRLTIYTIENGLPTNSVKRVQSDQNGFCWIATESGLVRFDGQKFRSYNASNIPGLRNDRIGTLSIAANGTICAYTAGEQTIIITNTGTNEAPKPEVTDNNLLVPISGYFTEKPKTLDSLVNIATGLLNNKDKRIYVASINTQKNQSYVFINETLYYIKNNKASLLQQDISQPSVGLSFLMVGESTLLKLQDEKIVGAWMDGKITNQFNTIYGDWNLNKTDGKKHPIQYVWTDKGTYMYANKNIYLLQVQNGILLSEKVISNIEVRNFSGIAHIPKENKYVICDDGPQARLMVVHPNLFTYPEMPNNTKDSAFYAQIVIGKNEIYSKNTIFSQNRKTKVHYTGSELNSGNRFTLLSPGKDLYFEHNSALCKYNFLTDKKRELFYLDDFITAGFQTEKWQQFYFLTQKSIYRTLYDSVLQKHKLPIAKTFSTCALFLGNDKFLIGSDRGLFWYDFEKNKIEKTILDSVCIWSLYQNQNNQIWVGTYGKGIYLIQDDKITAFPLGPDDALKIVHCFIDDGKGYFWLSTNNGLFKVAKEELLAYAAGKSTSVFYYLYNKNDGLLTNEFNGSRSGSYLWMPDSMLSLTSMKGLVWFYPNRTPQPFPNENIYIDRIVLNGSLVKEADLKEIKPGNHTITFNFVTPYYGNREHVSIEYKLNGYSEDWEALPPDGILVFQNLPAGSYDLKLRKRNAAEYGSYHQLAVPFKITPHFYNTLPFYLLVGTLFLLLILWLFWWRTQNLKQKALLLEQKILERTEDLQQTVKKLEQSQSSLRESNEIKDNLVSMVLHDLRSPIRFLALLGNNLAKGYKTMGEDELHERIDEIRNSTGSIYSYTNQFLTWSSTQHGLYSIMPKDVMLMSLFENIRELYKEMANYQKNKFVVVATDLVCFTDEHLLTAILRNLVDNAMKFTQNGEIILKAEKTEAAVSITITDTGRGMTESQIAYFFGNNTDPDNIGLGRILVRDLLSKLQGEIEVKSKLSVGTTIAITIFDKHLPSHTV